MNIIDKMVMEFVTSNYFLNNVCMYYRHDFGLLCPEEQEEYRLRAKDWLIAWAKTMEEYTKGDKT